ncbi:histidinol dehydrogenase [Archaeoglobus sulfaticallidus PM70-1]|uniref:Histidinol dehydrogenase n=1 Tax=Archaeoglobus sulfaticallidus PM70-1 TaxID=387631 RepID=N0BEY6_9EURY|nr:histidinol dehydrogenase [Archaeoglobus sulfaticallidus]AGK61568.1 histidinol dehydrogenase [Archaeoglobus sulfaticallidus PM70-1]
MIVSKDFILNLERKKSLEDVFQVVREIIDRVKRDGDKALLEITNEIDGVDLKYIRVPEEEFDKAYDVVEDPVIDALELAKENISNFHSITSVDRDIRLDFDHMILGKKYTPINSAGIYIPGGRASYPSTALMAGIPAKIAGVKRLVACTPPNKEGRVNALTLVACDIVEFDEVYAVGGAQAISALAYGTETIERVDKIAGPGNKYVTAAKLLVQNDVAIDMPAGPSEILVIADETANTEFIAYDVCAQLEHDPSSIAVVLCTTEKLAKEIETRVGDLANEQMSSNFYTCVADIDTAIAISNSFAPEHLTMVFEGAEDRIDEIENAGSVFIGNHSPVASGDYASGTNHILPTSGYAKIYSGLSVETFLKHITYQMIKPEGLKMIGHAIMKLAEAEGLPFHKKSVKVRLKEDPKGGDSGV